MAENIVDALIVTMGLDNSDYERGMNEVEDRTRQFSERAPRDVERGLNSIEQRFGATFQGIFRTFIAPLTAALGTMGIFSQYTQTADRIGKMAARIGASAEELQAFGEAAKRSGGSVEGFMSSFESLNGQIQRMQAMGGKGRLTPILKQLGISATENGKAKDTFQILRELAGASERIGKQKFAGLARFLGLDQGTIMLLQQGRIALDEVIKRQKELGVYTKQDFEITAKFNDAVSDLQQSFKQLAAPILRVITPALTTLAGWLTNIVQTFREHQGFIVAGLTVIAATMSGVLLKAAIALGAALMPLLLPIAAIAGLGLIFDEIATYAEGGETALQGLWEAIGTPEDFKAVGKAVQDFASSAWETISGLAKDVGGAFVDVVSEWGASFDAGAFVKRVKDAFSSLKTTLKELFTPDPALIESAGKAFDSAISAIGKTVKGAVDWLIKAGEALSGLWKTDGFDAVKSVIDSLSDAAKSLFGAFDEVFKLIGDVVTSVLDVFSPPEPGEEWGILKTLLDSLTAAAKSISDAMKTAFDWIGSIAKRIREAVAAGDFSSLKNAVEPIKSAFNSLFSVVKNLSGLLKDAVSWVTKLFLPDDPDGSWSALKKLVDVISLAIQSLAYVAKEIFNWIDEKITAIRNWLSGNGEEEKRAQKDILGDQTKEAYIATQAAKIKAGSPGMSDAQATKAAEKQLAKQTDQQVATNRSQDNDALWLSMVDLGGTATDMPKPAADAPDKLAVETSKKLSVDAPDKLAVDTSKKLSVDAPKTIAVDAPNKLAVDTSKKLSVDVPKTIAVDAPDKLAVDTSKKLAVDVPKIISVDAPDKIAVDVPKPAADAPIKAKDQPSPSWWNALFSSKAVPEAAAAITSRAPDAAKIQQDNSRKTTVNVKNDTVVNNRFEGVTDGNAAGLMNDAANSTQRAVERGNSFAVNNGTAAFNPGVFK